MAAPGCTVGIGAPPRHGFVTSAAAAATSRLASRNSRGDYRSDHAALSHRPGCRRRRRSLARIAAAITGSA